MGWGFPNHKPWVTPEWKVNEQSCWTRRRVFLNLGTRSGSEVCRGAEEGERQGQPHRCLETRTGRMSESSGDLTVTSPYPTHQSPDPTTLTCHTAPSTLCHINPRVDEYAWVLTSATNWTGHTTQMSCTRRTKVASTCWEDWGPLLKLFMTQQTSRDGWLRLDCTLNSIWGWKRAGC